MSKSDTELKKALKDLGDLGIVAGLEQEQERTYPRVVPTGFAAIDFGILKRGGLPYGKITEIYGEPGTCKSMWLYQIISNFQKQDKRLAVLIDTEFAIQSKEDWEWLRRNGVDTSPDRLRVIQDNSAESTFDQMLTFAESGAVGLIALDSLGNMEPGDNMSGKRFELDKKTGKSKSDRPGVMAKVTTTAIHRLTKALRDNDICYPVVNQVRDNLNPYSQSKWTTPGGRSFKHARSVVIELIKLPDIKVGTNIEGHKIKAKVIRSKMSPPGETNDTTHLEFYLSGGGEKRELFEVYNAACMLGFVVKKGAWIKCETLGLTWQGQEKVIADLETNPDLMLKLKAMIAEKRDVISATIPKNEEDAGDETV